MHSSCRILWQQSAGRRSLQRGKAYLLRRLRPRTPQPTIGLTASLRNWFTILVVTSEYISELHFPTAVTQSPLEEVFLLECFLSWYAEPLAHNHTSNPSSKS